MIKTWKERKGLKNSEPFRAFIGVEWEMQAEIDELRAALVAIEDAVRNVHKAKGRHHSQLSMCGLYDLVELPNTRPGSGRP